MEIVLEQFLSQIGFKALYISGSGVSTASFGLPDLGIINLEDILQDVRRITSVVSIPVLVDMDTGFGSSLNVEHAIRKIEMSGAAGVHIEDQEVDYKLPHGSYKHKRISTSADMCGASFLSDYDNLSCYENLLIRL